MITIHVCVGSACHLKGSYDIIKSIQRLIETSNLTKKVELKGAFCLGYCTEGVSVKINEEDTILSVNEKNVEEFFKAQVLGRI
jgi:NADH:ubiquinone oxidoreductase 24 kD subunit